MSEASVSGYKPDFLDGYLEEYYKHLYPSKLICKWLGYGEKPSEYLARREIAFIFENDKHHRFQSFTDGAALEKALVSKKPHKIDIGAVYSVPPSERNRVGAHAFVAEERELVFDIDLTDYDKIRTCCQSATVCKKCWGFISLSAKILDKILTKHFGFKHKLFIFSGRRGMHCWVGDEKARKLSNPARSAIAEYLSFRMSQPPFKQPFIHPRAADICRVILDSEEAEEFVIGQKWMSDQFLDKLLEYCKERKVYNHVKSIFTGTRDESQRWHLLKTICDPTTYTENKDQFNDKCPSPPSYDHTVFFYSFLMDNISPKLDIAVSTATNHLLKSPFCVHPKTGLVAVPFRARSSHLFDVDNLPRVDNLISQVKQLKADSEAEDNKENRKILYYKKTALAPFIENFEDFINNLTTEKKET